MKKAIVMATLAAIISTPALAWGPREQGIVTGIAGYWLYQKLDEAGKPKGPPVQSVPQTVYVVPSVPAPQMQHAPQRLPNCQTIAVYDVGGNFLGYQLHCAQ